MIKINWVKTCVYTEDDKSSTATKVPLRKSKKKKKIQPSFDIEKLTFKKHAFKIIYN